MFFTAPIIGLSVVLSVVVTVAVIVVVVLVKKLYALKKVGADVGAHLKGDIHSRSVSPCWSFIIHFLQNAREGHQQVVCLIWIVVVGCICEILYVFL